VTIDQLRKALQARPFNPFVICLADGQRVRVRSSEFVRAPPGPFRTFVVADPDGTFRVLDLLRVTSLEFRDGRARRRPAATK